MADIDLNRLNHWPPRTRGYESERIALEVLLALCREHGFGAMCQMAENMHGAWRGGEHAEKAYGRVAGHLKAVADLRNGL